LSSDSSKPVTELLVRWQSGDESALQDLIPLVYDELRRLARHYLEAEQNHDMLQSTALVHEAYLRLVGHSPSGIEGRAHFFGIAARLMRQILVDHARSRRAAKRSGGSRITLDESVLTPQESGVDVMALDDALNELSRLDAQQAKIVELRFFAGLSIEDTSRVLAIAPATVKRNWANARLWLRRELSRSAT
jgi:RNA polymerase sigma factor (TIGR02999 family)